MNSEHKTSDTMTEQVASDSSARSLDHHLKRAVLALLLVNLVLCASLLMFGGPALYFFNKKQSAIVQAVEPAGQVVSVALVSQPFIMRSLVQTDRGFYVLAWPMVLKRNQALTLELRANRDRYLCAEARRCTRLMED